MTGEDLRYKPGVVEQGKFEYFPLGKVFNKGFEEDGKKEGLWKRLINMEDKNKSQLKEIKNQEKRQLSVIKKQGTEQQKEIKKQTKQVKKIKIEKKKN